MILRPYQSAAFAAIREAYRAGKRAPLLVSPTGSGKTVLFSAITHGAAAKGNRVLLIAHRIELIDQISAALTESHTEHGFVCADYPRAIRQTMVASVQTLVRRLDKLPEPQLIIVDECFAAGTLIDGRPIEAYISGDMVRSFNHECGRIEKRAVVRTFRSVPRALCRVVLGDGRAFVCTPSHPFCTLEGEYVEACQLIGRSICTMHHLRDPGVAVTQGQARRLPPTRQDLLFAGMQRRVSSESLIRDNGEDEQEICVCQDDGEQSDGQSGESREDGGDAQTHKARPEDSWRQRQGDDTSSADAVGALGGSIRAGVYTTYQDAPRQRISRALQDRSGSSGHQACRGDRRSESRRLVETRARPEKNKLSDKHRVARIEILEPTSDGTFGGMLPDGHVYNLEVEGNHNYFVDDVLVHNCHHAVASTYKKIITKWPAARVLGVTATPCRTSGEGLGEIFDTLILGPTVAELTALNFLVPARIFSPPTMDTSGLHVRAGDYKTEEAEALADRPSVTGDALTHYRKHADGKRALAFTVSVKHAHNVAAQFRDAGVPAYALDGGTDKTIRRQALADFRDGKIRVLSSAEIFSEGLDVPAVEAGILLRPTASMGLYLQQVGRCLRPFHGKAQALILDHAANTQRFGLPSDDREWSLAGTEPSKRKKPATLSVRVCPACFAANRAGAPICTNCGAPFPVQAREVEERDGELTEITPEMLERRHQRKLQGRAQTLEQLREFGRSKNYAPGWADHIWAARQRKLQGTRHATLGNGRERIGSDRADTAGALEW